MLGAILKILSILGILLGAVLALVAVVLLLVLFFPVSYRVSGEKNGNGLRIQAKVKWLFGLLRVNYRYPEPGRVIARSLCFKLYDAKIPGGGEEAECSGGKKSGKKDSGKKEPNKGGSEEKDSGKKDSDKKDAGKRDSGKVSSGEGASEEGEKASNKSMSERREASAEEVASEGRESFPENASSRRDEDSVEKAVVMEVPGERGSGGIAENESGGAETSPASSPEESGSEFPGDENVTAGGKISQKIAKIKYTILSIYDKIKEIWGNIKYYIELLQEEDTKQLFSHVWFRFGKILRHVRPRRLRADILFGTGSPDTTGYAYGAYCMLSSALGPGVWVTPDFERAVLEAEFEVAGHITLWVLLVNAVKLLLDQRLRQFIRKIKAGKSDPIRT